MRKTILLTLLTGTLLAGCGLAKTVPPIESLQPITQEGTTMSDQGAAQQPAVTPPQPDASPLTSSTPSASPSANTVKEVNQVILKTSKGDMTIELYPQEIPKTVHNFLAKMKSGEYRGRIFHRVESWVIQGGDPTGTGTGGGKMPTELSNREFVIGSVGVARGGDINVSNDSQFFICTAECSWLTGQYTNFGKVTEGMDVAKKIEVGDKILDLVPATAPKR